MLVPSYRVHAAEWLAPDIRRIVVSAPDIAVRRKPGQFVIVHLSATSERIPLTIVDSDSLLGTITLIVQGIGKSTKELNLLESGNVIRDIVGPLGKPSTIKNWGTVAIVGGGVGSAIAYPIASAAKSAGNHTIAILGAKTANLLILEKEMNEVVDELIVTTNDGSRGLRGFVTTAIEELLRSRPQIDHLFAMGPVSMMKAVSQKTCPLGIPTTVSLNPIMIDGTGMCGGCRVVVGGKTVFACVDGPEFDAAQVDFDTLEKRNCAYRSEETQALQEFLRERRTGTGEIHT